MSHQTYSFIGELCCRGMRGLIVCKAMCDDHVTQGRHQTSPRYMQQYTATHPLTDNIDHNNLSCGSKPIQCQQRWKKTTLNTPSGNMAMCLIKCVGNSCIPANLTSQLYCDMCSHCISLVVICCDGAGSCPPIHMWPCYAVS